MQRTLEMGMVVLGLLAGCARDTDSSGDPPGMGMQVEQDAGMEPGGGEPADNFGGGTTSGEPTSSGSDTANTNGAVAAPDAGPGGSSGTPGQPGAGASGGLAGDGGFDPCNIPGLPSGTIPDLPIPGLPEAGISIPGCP